MLRLCLPLAFSAALCACGPSLRPSEVPVTPSVLVDQAGVQGRVVDASALPVEGAEVWCAETDERVRTDAEGRFSLVVPADSTVTLRALKPLYTSTTVQSFSLRPQTRLDGLELLMIPSSTLGAFNQLAGPSEDRGVVAVTVVSLSGRCSPAGATVAIDPVSTAKTVYVRDGDHRPDVTVPAMQARASPHAWVVGVAPGSAYTLTLTSGCARPSLPVVWRGADWQAEFRMTRSLTQLFAFTE